MRHPHRFPALSYALAVLVPLAAPLAAADAAKVNVPSAGMKTDIPVEVVLPSAYKTDATAKFPVIYEFHGAGDHEDTCLSATALAALADQYGTIVVCPYAKQSWYFDSPVDAGSQYETFVAKELVSYVDGHYRTKADRAHRATLGSSMGGHGALFIAIRHQDTFSIAAAMSGGMDFRAFPDNWNLKNLLGPEKENQARWDDLVVVNQAKTLKDGDLAISFECGVGDFFLDCNRALHQELLAAKISHDYTERPGWHGWDYWPNAIKYQMMYIAGKFAAADAPPKK